MIIRDKRPSGDVVKIGTRDTIEYLTFPALEQCRIVEHLFSTRLGGVSEGIWSSMNLGFQRGDEPKKVIENYRRIAAIMHCEMEDFVCSHQTHTTNIRRVTIEDRGKGICRERDYQDIDGLVTNDSGIVLVTYYADCVPLYFVDPENHAIGLAHSGWRGTVGEMGACMCRFMEREFGTRPKDLIVAIGPSICRDCYEVSEDVALEFEAILQGTEDICLEIAQSGMFDKKVVHPVTPGKAPGKYQLDLWLSNVIVLRKAGVQLSNISVADICTCHNPEYLFSHRASHGQRGSLAAFLKLKGYETEYLIC